MNRNYTKVKGHLEIRAVDDGEQYVFIHGDKNGLLSLSKLIAEIATIDQTKLNDLPIGAKEHVHLSPNVQLSKSSNSTIVGRLDAKGYGDFHDSYIPKDVNNE